MNQEALDHGLKFIGSVVRQSMEHNVKVKRESYKAKSLGKNLKIENTHIHINEVEVMALDRLYQILRFPRKELFTCYRYTKRKTRHEPSEMHYKQRR